MVDHVSVDRKYIEEKYNSLKEMAIKLEDPIRIPPAHVQDMKPAHELYKKTLVWLKDTQEMISLVDPDLKGLDEDRCNWLIIAEDLEKIERNLSKIESIFNPASQS